MIRGVGDRQVVPLPEPIGEEVVEDPAVLAAQDRVLGPADRELLQIVGEQELQKRLSLWPPCLDLAHVGDVEDAAGRAHREVLGTDPLVLHRHLPARERDQPRPGADVSLIQRSPSQRRRGHTARL